MLSIYPACFFVEKTGECNVAFPDFNDATTFGLNFNEAMSMAIDLLAGRISDIKVEKGDIPTPTELDKIKPEERYPELAKDCENVFVNMVSVDVDEYAKKHFNKAVRKNVTIPTWLSDKAMEHNLNLSQLLQKAIKEELNLD